MPIVTKASSVWDWDDTGIKTYRYFIDVKYRADLAARLSKS